MADFASGVAVCVSLLSLAVAGYSSYKVQRRSDALFYLSRYSDVEARLSDWPETLELFGVDLEAAERDGVSPSQITFLILSINTLRARTKVKGVEFADAIREDEYRKQMFDHEITRRAWRYSRRTFVKKVRSAVDDFLESEYDDTEPGGSPVDGVTG